MYDSYGLELCTMYDSYDVYLRVLWTIYMYKFSIYHIVVFTGFFIPFTDFRQKITRFLAKIVRKSPRRFSEKLPIYR
jgi:hypothetical protein